MRLKNASYNIHMNKRVLVVGGSYFIGRSIVDEFLRAGYDVYVLNRGSVKPWDRRIKQIICDRDNGSMLKEALYQKDFEIVIDVCGLNSKQAERLCEALNREMIETFVFLSSSSVYDVKTLEIPYREDDRLGENPYWWEYGADKIKAEFYYTGQFVWTDTRLVIIRPPYVYGENNYVQRESFIFKHIAEGKPVIIPASNPRLQFIYAPDLADFVLCSVENVKENINIFNVGNSESMTAREWVEACALASGGKADIIEYDYAATGRNVRDFFPFYDYDNVLDVSKMKSVYKRETDFIHGLRNAYAWYCKNADTILFKENVSYNEKQILEELEAARKKAERDSIVRTAKSDDAEAAEWFAGQIKAQRSGKLDLGTDEDFDSESIVVRKKKGSDKKAESNPDRKIRNSVYISKDKSMMNVMDVYKLLAQSSMASGRSTADIAKAIANSECYALFDEDLMIGFARVVTDKVSIGILCDFTVDLKNGGKDNGSVLMEYIKSDEALSGVKVITSGTSEKSFLKNEGFSKSAGYMESIF